MQLTTLPIDDLKPAPYNPRVPLKPGDAGWEKLRRSLEEFGLVQPIVWNRRTGHVVGGHQRLEVLRNAGRSEIECVVVDLPLEREQALNVALNNQAVGGEWDPGRLVALLDELQQLSDFDPTLTGFDEQELADLVLVPDPDPPPRWGLDDDEATDQVRVTLEVPPECWEEVEAALDELLAAEPQVTLHVTGHGMRDTGRGGRGKRSSLSPGGRGTALGAQRPGQGEGDERAQDVVQPDHTERARRRRRNGVDQRVAPSP